jgi:hypothetical protein
MIEDVRRQRDVAESELKAGKAALEEIRTRCGEAETQLSRSVESVRAELAAALREARDEQAKVIRDLEAQLEHAHAATDGVRHILRRGEEALRDMEARLKARQDDTDRRVEEQMMIRRDLEQELECSKQAFSARTSDFELAQSELKRVNGMKRFLEADLKKRCVKGSGAVMRLTESDFVCGTREADVVQLTKEKLGLKAQLDQRQHRMQSAEILYATDKARLEKLLAEARSELEATMSTREENLARLSAAEEQIEK